MEVMTYHEETKHNYYRYARSLRFMDWDAQPNPFRLYDGAPKIDLHFELPDKSFLYDTLYAEQEIDKQPINGQTIGSFLRYSLGLSAWKHFGEDKWALRINPSSGNLHPTECYVILSAMQDWSDRPGVYHYAPEHHQVELRGSMNSRLYKRLINCRDDVFLIALTSIPWRESWKYGERAFRYCQHDIGHAIAALRFSARMHGWTLRILPNWPTQTMKRLLGLHRANDFHAQEQEEPELIAVVSPHSELSLMNAPSPDVLADMVWNGKANILSPNHHPWPIIDSVIASSQIDNPFREFEHSFTRKNESTYKADDSLLAKDVILQRRSAQMFDGTSVMSSEDFLRILSRTLPSQEAPWDMLYWAPCVHLFIFVHRIKGIAPGMYMLLRNPRAYVQLKDATCDTFVWKRVRSDFYDLDLYLLKEGDFAQTAIALSCNQDIAGDSYFSMGMLSAFSEPIETFGPWFYRNLFWETGIIGQTLYLEAEAVGARATGIGCYFDDPVHQALGLKDNAFQSLYHFTIGNPLVDKRLTTLPGYNHELRLS